MPEYSGELRAHRDARFAIIASRWNPGIVDALIDGARRTLLTDGVDAAAVDVIQRARRVGKSPRRPRSLRRPVKHAAIIALGCVVRGDNTGITSISPKSGMRARPHARVGRAPRARTGELALDVGTLCAR